MRRDSIFYQLFQQSPTLLFELLEVPPPDAQNYRFDSVAVKEAKFEIDGVFLPPQTGTPGTMYFCEVQFQKDELLYERLFGESFLYFYRNRDRFSDWQAVVIYPFRALEQSNTLPYQDLLVGNRVHRVYLNELGEMDHLSLGVALMVLTTLQENQAPEAARNLLVRSQQEVGLAASRAIIDMVTTIMVYKFARLNRVEVEAMLGLNLQETRVYQEAEAEGEKRGRLSLILKQLSRQVQCVLPQKIEQQVRALSLEQLEALGEALLDFTRLQELVDWLETQQEQE